MIASKDMEMPIHRTRLRTTTLWVVISLCFFFVSRTIGTFFPRLYQNIIVAQISEILSVLGSVALLLFFVFFLTDYATNSLRQLRSTAIVAIIGSALIVLLYVKGLFILFQGLSQLVDRVSPSVADLIWSQGLGVALSLLGSLFILFFFMVFRGKIDQTRQPKLKKAARIAVIGSLITALLQTLTLFNYVLLRQLRWFLDNPKAAVSILLPIVAIGFACNLYFYTIFYKLRGADSVQVQQNALQSNDIRNDF
jgi:hypothetical protein